MNAKRTYWLSFIDPDKRAGQRFLGVAIVDVTQADADRAAERLAVTHPQARPGAQWIAAAAQRAWDTGCNPGGEVGTIEITGSPDAATAPRDQLLSQADLVALHLIDRPS